MTVQCPDLPPTLARALAARLRDAVRAADRLASFVFDEPGTEPVESGLADGEELATARDFVLRVFHGASDPVNSRILGAAVLAGGAGVDALARDLGLTRMALLERVNDLIQLGLVARDLPNDLVRPTPAGEGVVELFAGLEIQVADWLRHRKRT